MVWGTGDLESNLIALLQRRLIDEAIDAPLEATASARLADIAAFLEGDFDDVRCARLLAGLVWAKPARLPFVKQSLRPIVPFAYAALKPIFAPDVSLKGTRGKGTGSAKLQTSDSSRLGLALAKRASRRSCAYGTCPRPCLGHCSARSLAARISQKAQMGRRLAAALLIPLDEYGLKTLMERAYPAEKENEDVD